MALHQGNFAILLPLPPTQTHDWLHPGGIEDRDVTKYPMWRTALATKNYPARSVNTAKVEKS